MFAEPESEPSAFSIAIRPSTVPMIPSVGEKPPIVMKTPSALLLRSWTNWISVSRILRMMSVSRPSMTSWMPLRMKSSSSAAASFSSASNPSRRAFSANETSVAITSRSW
jgi:hypothetical protein